MSRLRYSSESKEDLKQIASYIAHDKPIAARQWVAKIKEKCRLIASHPSIGDARPEFGEGIRSSYLGSYEIFFRCSDSAVEIVLHCREAGLDEEGTYQAIKKASVLGEAAKELEPLTKEAAPVGSALKLLGKAGPWLSKAWRGFRGAAPAVERGAAAG